MSRAYGVMRFKRFRNPIASTLMHIMRIFSVVVPHALYGKLQHACNAFICMLHLRYSCKHHISPCRRLMIDVKKHSSHVVSHVLPIGDALRKGVACSNCRFEQQCICFIGSDDSTAFYLKTSKSLHSGGDTPSNGPYIPPAFGQVVAV